MAVMVPRHVDASIVVSERRVFEALRSASSSDNWTVLHSLGVSSAWTGEFGEIDFVVLIPGLGIVCIEVKGGGVSVADGVWTTRNRYGATDRLKRSPYRQAQEGQWKLLAALKAKFGAGSQEARCPVGWLVVFPDVASPPRTPEATGDEVIARDELDGDIGSRIRTTPSLAKLAGRTDLVAPSAATCSRMLSFLRPDFERVPFPASEHWDTEERLKILTEEQFEALDNVSDNPVCLLRGPAGTGKTLIGIEQARRIAQTGRSVLVSCFNGGLGGWLQDATAGFGPGRVVAGHLHGLLRDRIANSPFAEDLRQAEQAGTSGDQLYGRLYYELGALAIEESGERFDVIVFDEVQDLPSPRLAELLKAWSHAASGTWILLLGDFTRQALYTGSSDASLELLRASLGDVAVFNLRLNCRNTRRIAMQTGILSGFGEQRLSDRQPEGEQVSLQFHADRASGLAKLEAVVRQLRESGIKAADVVILGARRRENSLLSCVSNVGGWPVRDIHAPGQGVAYATAHAFKGLERKVVIVIDADARNEDESDAILYVAMSRARLRLFILAPETSRPIMEKRLTDAVLATLAQKAS
ncbi:nuclease-related domain-containing DEAD/DEAH box helicase [Lichenibacterium dinghuense]|uniref:nuclease-related domain-containing DEAD/DEAH box helicase n=1 Tax=Lichenibacterium dinghuense TaxID=2895977 RepID=UPI001F1E61EA|nr:NERD domain-containing protein [Lichenibacterium sp. 6Y81]